MPPRLFRIERVIPFLILLFAFQAPAQSISHSVIGSTGFTSSDVDFTVGETLISGGASGVNILTEGFHQPLISSISMEEDVGFTLSYFPNPFRNEIIINSDFGGYEIVVSDILGKILFREEVPESVHSNRIRIPTDDWAAQTYLLNVVSSNATAVHRIVKIY